MLVRKASRKNGGKMKTLYIFVFTNENDGSSDIDWAWANNEDEADAIFWDNVAEYMSKDLVTVDECYTIPGAIHAEELMKILTGWPKSDES